MFLYLLIILDGAFKKLKTEGESGGMSVHNPSHNPTSSCPTPARRRHRTTFTQVGLPLPPFLLQASLSCRHTFRSSYRSWRQPSLNLTTRTFTAGKNSPGRPSWTRPEYRWERPELKWGCGGHYSLRFDSPCLCFNWSLIWLVFKV